MSPSLFPYYLIFWPGALPSTFDLPKHQEALYMSLHVQKKIRFFNIVTTCMLIFDCIYYIMRIVSIYRIYCIFIHCIYCIYTGISTVCN